MSYLPAANRTVNSPSYTFGWPLPLGDCVFGHWPEKQLVRLEEQCQGLEYECLSRDIRAPDGSHQAVHQALLCFVGTSFTVDFCMCQLEQSSLFFCTKSKALEGQDCESLCFCKGTLTMGRNVPHFWVCKERTVRNILDSFYNILVSFCCPLFLVVY